MKNMEERQKIMDQIGWGIGRAMVNQRMSQYKLADALQERGILYTQTSVSLLVNGKADAAFSVIVVISQILGISIDQRYAMGTKPLQVPLGRPPRSVRAA